MISSRRINWIIPMCGNGTRTAMLGSFKPLIKICNKAIFEHFIYGIKHHINEEDLVTLIIKSTAKNYLENYEVLSSICKKITPCKTINKIFIDHDTKGPCDTVRHVLDDLADEDIGIIINPDQKIDFELERGSIDSSRIYLAIGFDTKKKSSYVQINKDAKIIKIKEKENISFYSSTGVYIFGSNKILKKNLNEFYLQDIKMYNGEHYISHLIEYAISKDIIVEPLETFLKYDLGNINSINNFKKIIF